MCGGPVNYELCESKKFRFEAPSTPETYKTAEESNSKMKIFGFTFSARDMWLLGIAGTLALAWIGFHLTNATNRKTRFHQAAATFRSRVLAELKGLYPVTQYWDMQTFPRFSRSITEIESAAAEFRFSVSRKRTFDAAVKEYCEYCKQISWEQCAAWSMYPSMRKEDEISPREKFDHLVKALLSFAEEK